MRSEFCPSGWRECWFWIISGVVASDPFGRWLIHMRCGAGLSDLRVLSLSGSPVSGTLRCELQLLASLDTSSVPSAQGELGAPLDYPSLSYGLALSPGSELGLLLVSPHSEHTALWWLMPTVLKIIVSYIYVNKVLSTWLYNISVAV